MPRPSGGQRQTLKEMSEQNTQRSNYSSVEAKYKHTRSYAELNAKEKNKAGAVLGVAREELAEEPLFEQRLEGGREEPCGFLREEDSRQREQPVQCKDPEVRPSIGYLKSGRSQGVWSRVSEEESAGNKDRELTVREDF